MLAEDEVYIGCKEILQRRGWIILAGQPPGGCDHLPVVEIKDPERQGIGSKGAYKPDLIATLGSVVVLVECKPRHSESDADKLRTILADPSRVQLLHRELLQRSLFRRRGLVEMAPEAFANGLRGALAHSGQPVQQADLLVIHVADAEGKGLVLASLEEEPAVRQLVEASPGP